MCFVQNILAEFGDFITKLLIFIVPSLLLLQSVKHFIYLPLIFFFNYNYSWKMWKQKAQTTSVFGSLKDKMLVLLRS